MKKFGTIDDILNYVFLLKITNLNLFGSTYILDGGQTKNFKFYEQSKIR